MPRPLFCCLCFALGLGLSSFTLCIACLKGAKAKKLTSG
jgi:hypothetical protein